MNKPPNQRIAAFEEDVAVGTGKFGRSKTTRTTSGTETGNYIVDCSILHVVTTLEEAKACEVVVPGAIDAFRRSFGEDSDGNRPYAFKPIRPDCKILLCAAGGGAKAYEGSAEIRNYVLRIVPKACVLTVHVRLHEVDPEKEGLLTKLLEQAVDYERTNVRLEGATSKERGPLFEGERANGAGPPSAASERPAVGDLVVALAVLEEGDGGGEVEVVGRVASVGDRGDIVVHADFAGAEIWSIEPDAILSVHPICGPKGGSADDAIRKLLKKAGDDLPVAVEDLQLAIVRTADTMKQYERTAAGWPVTSDVIDAALAAVRERIADAAADVEPGAAPSEDTLPAEA